jgi:hypothetical protein
MLLAQPGERAALLSAFYGEGYLAFTLPAMLAGFLAPVVGLTQPRMSTGRGNLPRARFALGHDLLEDESVAKRRQPAAGDFVVQQATRHRRCSVMRSRFKATM